MIGIIDYGMGNLRNVQKAFDKLGYASVISDSQEVLGSADRLVLPGVGAFEQAIAALRERELDTWLQARVASGMPLLGICLGMQLLFETSYENGEHKGLGFLPGEVVKFDVPLKIPHMGWNTLDIVNHEGVLAEVPAQPYVYFVHSYHVQTDAKWVCAYTDYGKRVPVAVQKDNVYGVQYHPEKSGEAGLKMLQAFATLDVCKKTL